MPAASSFKFGVTVQTIAGAHSGTFKLKEAPCLQYW